MKWTEADEKTMLKAVSAAASVPAAIDAVRIALPGRNVTADALRKKLEAMGKPSLSELVAKNAPKVEYAAREERTPKNELAEHRLRLSVKELEDTKAKLLSELDTAHKKIGQLQDLRAIKPLKPVNVPKGRGEGKQRRGVPVMLCSDWHVEEPVDSAKVNGLNRFDLDVADDCITKLADAFEWMLRDPRYDCREAIVWLGGDLFSGHIHEELVEKNFLSPIRATAWLLPRIEKMLRKILATCPNIDRLLVPCNDGNHGRITNKIRIASRTENSLEWLLYFTLAERMRDEPRIEFQISEGEYNYLRIFDQTLCFFHGDSVKYAGGVGGILVPMKRGLNELRKYPVEVGNVDVFNVGHFHQYTNHGDIVVNGSVIGVNPYSMRYKLPPEPRRQAWYLLDQTRGKCLSAPIWLPKTGLI